MSSSTKGIKKSTIPALGANEKCLKSQVNLPVILTILYFYSRGYSNSYYWSKYFKIFAFGYHNFLNVKIGFAKINKSWWEKWTHPTHRKKWPQNYPVFWNSLKVQKNPKNILNIIQTLVMKNKGEHIFWFLN